MYCTYVRLCTVISGQEVGIMLIDSRSSSAAFYPNEVPRIFQRHQMKAKTNLSKAKSRRGFTLVEMLVVIGMIAALAGISFPVYKSIQAKVERQQFQMAFASIERAADNFVTEYNYLPYVEAAYPPADNWYRDTTGTIDQTTTLLAGIGNTCNFKKINFLEISEPKGGPGNYSGGLLVTGTAAIYYDPWGKKIQRMRFDHDQDGEIVAPWGTSVSPEYWIKGRNVIFYSWGADGAASGPGAANMADNVYSWTDKLPSSYD